MPSLLELQERFAAALESRGPPPLRGLDVYRHAIDANYRRAMGATYPVVRDLLGAAEFEKVVDAFVAAHPPDSGDLNIYGDAFAAFLENHLPARTHLRDMARLEWAIDESARAPDADSTPGAVIAALAVLEEEAVGQVRVRLHPSCRLVSGVPPVYEAWSACQGATSQAAREDENEFLLVKRHEGRTLVERIGAGEFTWLRALESGASFGDALARALESDATFELERALSERVHDGTICAVDDGRYNRRHG